MTAQRLVEFCDNCGTPLRRDNPRPLCAECQWYARNSRLLAAEREHQAARRRAAVQQRIHDLDSGRGTA